MKAIAYARVSTSINSQELLENQLKAIRAFANDNKCEIVKEYSEVSTLIGPEFAKMMGMVALGYIKADFIYIDSIDRFSRCREKFEEVREMLNSKGTEIVFLKPETNCIQ